LRNWFSKSGRGVRLSKQSRPARFFYWIIAILLAAALLYFSLRGIAWAQVWLTLSRAKANYIVLWILLSSGSLFLRALRWRILLRSAAPVKVSIAFWATAAGYLGNNYLPARAGEVIRSVMVSFHSGLSKTFVLTTAFLERLCDAVALVLISSIVLLTLASPPGWFARAARPFAILGLCGVVAIAITPRLESLWAAIISRVPVPEAIREKLLRVIQQILTGMRGFHSGSRLLAFILFTAIIWYVDIVGIMIGAYALGLHLPVSVAFLLIAGLGLGSALPSTPGYVGIYQFVAVSVLDPFGFHKADAIALILLFQALQYLVITFWGLLAFTQSRRMSLKGAFNLSGAAVSAAAPESQQTPG